MQKRPRARHLKLVTTSAQEAQQMRQLLEGNAWQLTYAEFLRRVEREYGFELCGTHATDPAAREVALPYLRCRSTGREVPLPGGLEMEQQLEESVTASLCRRLGIPPEDFGLQPEEPIDGDPSLYLEE